MRSGPRSRAAGPSRRVAVAMSGGVDSAVALLEARDAGHEPVGVTLRLWTDPAGPGRRACVLLARGGRRGRAGACHAPRRPARDARPARRASARRSWRRSSPGYATRGDARTRASAATAASASPRFSPSLAASGRPAWHGSLRTPARASRAAAARPSRRRRQGPVLHARPARSRACSTASGSRSAGGRRRRLARARATAGLAAASRPESQEACFLAGGDYRDFLDRHGLAPGERADRRRGGHEVGRHDGFWRFTHGQRRGLGVATGAAALRARHPSRRRTRSSSGPRESLGPDRRSACRPGGSSSPSSASRPSFAIGRPAAPARVEQRRRGFRLALERARLRRRAGAGRRPVRGRRRRRAPGLSLRLA